MRLHVKLYVVNREYVRNSMLYKWAPKSIQSKPPKNACNVTYKPLILWAVGMFVFLYFNLYLVYFLPWKNICL